MHVSRWPFVALLLLSVVSCGRSGGDSSGGRAIVDVEPKELVRGRQMTITVIGDGTKWKKIDAGDIEIRTRDGELDPSIAVLSVNAANEQYLEIELDIAVDSLRDIRDLRIGKDRLDGVLSVEAPFEVVEATTVAPGHFFRLALKGRETDWIPGAVTLESSIPEVLFEGIRVSPDPSFGPDDIVTALGVEVLRNDFLYVTGYVEFFAPPGPLDVTIHAAGDQDVFPAALEVAPLQLTDLTSGSLAATLEQPFETHVYRAALPADSVCTIDYFYDDPSQLISLEVYNPTDPQTVFYDSFRYWSYGYYESLVVWNPQDLIVLVHDLSFGGGDEYAYGLDYECTTFTAEPLTANTPVLGETMATPGQIRTYEMAPSPWTYVDLAVEPTGISSMYPEFYLYLEGAFDRSPYEYFSDLPIASARALSGTRGRAIAQLNDYYDNTGVDSEYSITWTETPISGTLFVSTVPPQSIPDANVIGDMQSYVDSTISIPAGTLPGALRIAVDVQHRYESDVYIDLISPQQDEIRVFEGYYNSYDVLKVVGLGVDDTPPPSVPMDYDDLADVELLDPVGTWTLRVYDTYPQDSGLLNGWALSVE